jgi:DNA-binding response OmpR family regulator
MEQNLSCEILVVEGFVNQSKSLSSHLEALDAPVNILVVNDAKAAFSFLEKNPIHLLIIDSFLRGNLDGFDLCRNIRSSSMFRQVPVILLLAGTLSLERSKGISAGADLLLQRPIVKEELCKMVHLLLEWSSYRTNSTGATVTPGQSSRHLRSVN